MAAIVADALQTIETHKASMAATFSRLDVAVAEAACSEP